MRNLLNNQDDVTSNSQALPGLEADDDRIRALWGHWPEPWNLAEEAIPLQNWQAQSPSLNLHFGPRVSSPSRQIQCPCLYLSLIQTILSAPNSELLLGFRLLYIWHNRNIFLILN